jgi:hypothetical protein
MYCHEISTSTNAVTSQSGLEAQLAEKAKMRVMFENYISIIHFAAIVGIDSCSFSSLPVQSQLLTATRAFKQEARKK